MPDLFQATESVIKTNQDVEFLSVNLKAKELMDQINWVITQRKVEYLPDLIALNKHKSVAVKRRIATGIGIIGKQEDAEIIQTWLDTESDRETWLILQASKDSLLRKNSDNTSELEKLTVAEAVSLVKKILGDKTYIIEGELTEIKPINNMFAFAVKDKEARLNCWMLANVSERKNIPMNEGLTVKLKGKFKLSKDSRLYFNVESLDLTGEGELLRNLKMLEIKLREEGLFDETRKRKIPILPEKILLLASSNGAAIHDFVKVLGERRKGLEIYHLPIKTQGIGAELNLLNALALSNSLSENFKIDTVVITRGGGSNDDLAVFNSERVVRAIYALNKPSIVAIGHEKDFTLSEYAADLRASTPSNAAELVSLSNEDVIGKSKFSFQEIYNLVQSKIINYQEVNFRLTDNILNIIRSNINQSKFELRSFDTTIQTLIGEVKSLNTSLYSSIFSLIQNQLTSFRIQSVNIQELLGGSISLVRNYRQESKFYYENILNMVTLEIQNLSYKSNLIASEIQQFDVKKVLEKGFTLVLQNGKVVETKKALKTGSITIQFQDGEVGAEMV
jgi:exodeoxyribonuclease VII large subunit